MKKFLSALILICLCACMLSLAACGKKYTVTFDADGGSFSSGQQIIEVEVQEKKTVEKPSAPQKQGYNFICWTLNGEEFDFSTQITEDITLKAEYERDYSTAEYEVTLTATEGVTVKSEHASGEKVKHGQKISFTLDIGAFYGGEPVVKANGNTVSADVNGVYTYTVTERTDITVSGIYKDVSAMTGEGTETDPYRVTKAVDLIFIAEKVNAGDAAYTSAYYQMDADIDLKNQSLDIIGDGSTENSIFSGYFTGNGHTISNFTIRAENKPYVGLFGYVGKNPSMQHSAIIYGLTLDNFYISASIVGAGAYVGSVVGLGSGATVMVCSAVNGRIDLSADDGYFSYVGGIMGVQQSFYYPALDLKYSSEIAYATSNVAINANSGYVFAAGGVSGYVIAADEYSNAYIHHSYSDTDITGAMRTGGIAGILGSYTSIATSYSSGNVSAQSRISTDLDGQGYGYAYAGGVVGYAENDCVVSDSFATGNISAYSAISQSYAFTGDIVGGGDESGAVNALSAKYTILNSYYALGGKSGNINLTSTNFLKQTLLWKDADWVFTEGQYPKINFEESSIEYTVTVDYKGYSVNQKTSGGFTYSDTYTTLSFWATSQMIDVEYSSDDGFLSYGLYFDSGLNNKVPLAYVVTRDVTLYVGFANVAEITGEYTFVTDNREDAFITLTADGVVEYSDGKVVSSAIYVYNGEYIIISSARFGRFAEGLTDDNYLSAYELYDFTATVSGGVIRIYDGVFFTEQNPLVATVKKGITGIYYVKNGEKAVQYQFHANLTGSINGGNSEQFTYVINGENIVVTMASGGEITGTVIGGVITLGGVTLNEYDDFKGTWQKHYSTYISYTFDGMGGGFIYKEGYIDNNGNYTGAREQVFFDYVLTEQDGKQIANLSNGLIAYFKDGFLTVENAGGYAQTMYGYNSYATKWQDFTNGAVLTLYGLNKDGVGVGLIEYSDGYYYQLAYERVAGYNNRITIYSGNDVFGRADYDYFENMLFAKLYVSSMQTESGYEYKDFKFCYYDIYMGEWITDDNADLSLIGFNGLGVYTAQIGSGMEGGKIEIDGKQVPYTLEGGGLDGQFTYNGVNYTFKYDDVNGVIVVTEGQLQITLERKDEFANITLIDNANGDRYSFDGRGNLATGGKMTISAKSGLTESYGYKTTADGLQLFSDEQVVGAIVKDGAVKGYKLTLNLSEKALYAAIPFSGEWAISNEYSLLEVWGADIDGKADGYYKGTKVTFDYSSGQYLSFKWLADTMYVFALSDGCVAVSPYTDVAFGLYTICAKKDALYGNWIRQDGSRTYVFSFDGVSDSAYVYGVANRRVGTSVVNYNYRVNADGSFIMWTTEAVNGTIYNYKIEWCNKTDSEAYVQENGDKAFKMVRIDSLYQITATDEDGVTYTFDGMSFNDAGTVTTSEGDTYTYQITAYDTENSKFIVSLEKDGNTFTATIDYTDISNVIIVIE